MNQNDHGQPRTIARAILLAMLLGSAVALGVILVDVSKYLSKMTAYEELHIGMQSAKAIGTLQNHGILCSIEEIPSGSIRRCQFSDYWRDYRIYFDPAGRIVVRKLYTFRSHMLINW